MNLIKLSATPSTNSYLKELRSITPVKDETVVVTSNQTMGRGQLSNSWQSHPSNSLTFSLYKELTGVAVSHQYYISIAVSLGVFNALTALKINNIAIKWPNDIMAEGKKCCGILIENSIKKLQVKEAIIGIGLNVNETHFDNLPNATSLFLASGSEFDIESVLQLLTSEILKQLEFLQLNKLEALHVQYHKHLYKAEKISVFENSEGLKFNGIIKGVTNEGLLIVKTEDDILAYFDLKQIKLLG